ncbi:molybdenum cofactor biosysynthesis protein [Curtobacterium flaccumfaciens]|uniref:molybdenum cofactor biosysynthesis protein n=1 Tax=Curtobacterium flaccumfaciens TaxID=2035 RepID=UPI0022058FA7|nr:molybdenum cofactor biosysynthesis protein [Curtobacterium flaccumfaciens]MCS0470976.1 molybdenum cofactor biosysynthesis protein [Curtobacterium flaccumfaciens pv. betae]MCS0475224.1 molybdenum cofactor biosysynthesis protein [Curtobacterium flaccumfaciens pv. betae]MCS0477388.1 molybdenum cofactor biosysynthesis protein [Curtobacterium flaccumfaciens pv. betae]MCS0481238.1 molybdenum cofactor biosysynthesis protein [Curtobacterium flaccumfaciens pv. betae]MCS0484424.1 molybdenum cofactor 
MTPADDVAGLDDLPFRTEVEVALLLVAPRHRYEGRPADGALPVAADDPDESRDRIELRAGLGIVGDRYFAARAHVHASVTVIGLEGLEAVGHAIGATVDPAATRRNVFLRGADVEALRGEPFSLESVTPDADGGPVRFRGYRAANPCAWMDHEVAPGAFRAMRGRGGVRCDPESDGVLTLGPAVLRTARPVALG